MPTSQDMTTTALFSQGASPEPPATPLFSMPSSTRWPSSPGGPRRQTRLAGTGQLRNSMDRAAYLLLNRLDQEGPMGVKALAAGMGIDSSTVTRQAAPLVITGLVKRTSHPEDGRAVVLQLSPARAGPAGGGAAVPARSDGAGHGGLDAGRAGGLLHAADPLQLGPLGTSDGPSGSGTSRRPDSARATGRAAPDAGVAPRREAAPLAAMRGPRCRPSECPTRVLPHGARLCA